MSMKRVSLFYILILWVLGNTTVVQAQKTAYQLSGKVVNEMGEAIPFATVYLPETQQGTASNVEGVFELSSINKSHVKVEVQSVGYESLSEEVDLAVSGGKPHVFTLKANEVALDEVVVTAKSNALQVREKAYTVSALDVKSLQNTNRDVGNVLRAVPGVNIREEGGLGSSFQFSINGLSGKQVKFFMNGVPMDSYGTSFSINTIPVNLIDRVEVYKGVVPVWLGSDALGGAVNLITRAEVRDYLDASYSMGSFNTHKVAISGKMVWQDKVVLEASAFYNYSDNNYQVDDLEKHDELGNVLGKMSASRFHDAYQSGMVQVKAGLYQPKFIDKAQLGLVVSGNNNQVQHGLSLERVFGQVHTTDFMVMPTIEVAKQDLFFEGLAFDAYASYIQGQYQVVDTSSREYRWDGSYTLRSNPNIGESDWQKSLFSFDDNTTLALANLKYEQATFEWAYNITYSRFVRTGSDPFDPDIVPFSEPNYLNKLTMGLSFTQHLLDKRLSVTPFAKSFLFSGKTYEEDLYSEAPETIEHNSEFFKPGFGVAIVGELFSHLKVKASYENTYRLPEGAEIFGNGLNVESNPQLQPEHSHNLNAGWLYQNNAGHHQWIWEANFFSRQAKRLIRQAATGAKSQYVNLAKASITGGETEVTYRWQSKLSFTLNLTYQNLINATQYDESGNVNYTYQDRLPNIPYLFGNAHLQYQLKDVWQLDDALGFYLSSRYVHEFYLQWPGHGGKKHTIPTQLIHSAEMNYAFNKGTYNISFGVNNLLDTKAYDNFRVQKPGRSIYLKLRYFLRNNHL